jgi:preprotein translocase subunit SecG
MIPLIIVSFLVIVAVMITIFVVISRGDKNDPL